ncbi:MAG: hypothetical protein WBV67_00240, partial [Candidatus Cybelea sp.]
MDGRSSQPALKIFQNVKVFDGKSRTLSGALDVLVKANTIEKISANRITAEPGADARVIEGRGRTLMPGLIDAHWHT